MYIDIVPNRGAKPTILLRRSFRKDGKVNKETIANLIEITEDQARAIQIILRGEKLVKQDDLDLKLEILHSAAHGHVKAVLLALERLQIDKLLGEENGKDRNLKLVKAMIICDVLELEPRHALIRDYADTTLGQSLGLENIEEKELHAAMDWLHQRQPAIEKQLAQRHLEKSNRIIASLSSCYLNDDLKVNFRLIADDQGCPISIYAYPGTKLISIPVFKDYLSKLLEVPDLKSVILVGDRVKIPQKMIDKLTESKDINWIAGMNTASMLELLNGINLSFDSLFDSYDLAEIPHVNYPEEKFIVWRNPDRESLRKDERGALVNSIIKSLDEIKELVNQGKLRKATLIKRKVDRVFRGHVLKEYFSIKIADRKFDYVVNRESLNAKESQDGVFVIRTSLTKGFSPVEIKRLYKRILASMTKKDFSFIETINPRTHPIFTYDEKEVNKYLFIRLLATYVKWRMIRSWQLLGMFIEHDSQPGDQDSKPTEATKSQRKRVRKKGLMPQGDWSAHNFRSLLQHLTTIRQNTCRKCDDGTNASTFIVEGKLNPSQQKVFDLLNKIRA
jgi:hypothetical protein